MSTSITAITPHPPRRAPRIIALIGLALAIGCGLSAHARDKHHDNTDEWMAILVDGQKSGYAHHSRRIVDGDIETSQKIHWQLHRSGVPISIEIHETSRETATGQPVSFSSEQKMSGLGLRVSGKMLDDHTLQITKTGPGSHNQKTLTWQPDWMMPEHLRRSQIAAFKKAGMQPGSTITSRVFVPSLEKALTSESRLGAMEDVDLLGHTQRLRHITETTDMGGFLQVSQAWVDDDFNVKKMQINMMGMTLEMIACPKACATAPDQPFDAFSNTLMPVPVSLSPDELKQPLQWTFHLRDKVSRVHLPNSLEQQSRIETLADGQQKLTVTIYPDRPVARASAASTDQSSSHVTENPLANHLETWTRPTPWLQSNAELIKGLTKKTIRKNQGPAEKMQAITGFVRQYISNKTLSVAYASALETARNRNGDCTEHAVLTAAMGRAAGIPTRIATGLVYTPEFEGKKNVLVPHAWTQAWVDGAWKSYDAALGHFDSGHIALEYGDGDPVAFYSSVQLIGNLAVDSVHAIKPANPGPNQIP